MTGGRTQGLLVALRFRFAAVADVWSHAALRRLTVAWSVFFMIDAVSFVALSVWAFDRGGARAVGVVALCRLLPGAMALPVGAWAADRFSRRRVVTVVFAGQSAVLAALVVATVADASLAVVAGLVSVGGVMAAPYRPAHLAMLPLVARSPHELVAANVAGGVVEGTALLVGPVLAALLLLIGGPPASLGLALAAALLGCVVVAGVHSPSDPSVVLRQASEGPLVALTGGIRVLRVDRGLALVVGCFVAQLFVRGVLNVLLVLASFDLLGLGTGGVGWLAAAMGAGATVGAGAAAGLAGRRRLGAPFALGLVLWGAPLAMIGLVPTPVLALVALAVIGAGNSLLDVSGFTLLQRLGDDRVLGRVFGVLFTGGIAFGGVGAIVAPTAVDAFGLRLSLVMAGSLLPLVALVARPGLRRIDDASEPPSLALLAMTSVELLRALPPTTLEKLAARSVVSTVPGGEVIVRQGDPADRFYVIVSGEVEVFVDGAPVRVSAAGECFGEMGLMRRAPRSATVRALNDVCVVAVGGQAFVDAVTGNSEAFSATTQVIDGRLVT
jgi:MFS family permease